MDRQGVCVKEAPGLLFTRRQIITLLLPLIGEQILSGIMGIADTMMVTGVGETAISAVSIVDSINTLVLNLLAALAAGGVIVCAQYLGRRDLENANRAARQVLLVSVSVGLVLAAVCLIFRRQLLNLIFGSAEQLVLDQAEDYFLYTALSYPFLALQQTSAAIFRSDGHATQPMVVIACSDVFDICANAVMIYGMNMGVVGASLSTLIARVLSSGVLMVMLRSKKLSISIRDYGKIRPNRAMIGMVLRVGIPTGVENSMFQLGKLVVQSTVSTLGTAAMAAQAMTHTLNLVAVMPGQAIGLGLLTVAGQCMGAGRVEEVKHYTKVFCAISEVSIIVMSTVMAVLTPLITTVAGMSQESASITFRLILLISVVRCFLWVLAFTMPYGMQAAGDVKFSAAVAALSMWIFRVGGSLLLCRVFQVGIVGVWIAWFLDWIFRVFVYMWRYRSGKWQDKQVIRS